MVTAAGPNSRLLKPNPKAKLHIACGKTGLTYCGWYLYEVQVADSGEMATCNDCKLRQTINSPAKEHKRG